MSRPIPLMCVCLAIASVPALAQKAKVVVAPFGAGDGASETAASKFQGLVIDELKTRTDSIDLIPTPSTRAAPPPPVAAGATKKTAPSPEALNALDAGRKAFDDLRFEDASASLKKGIEAMIADPATADGEALTDAYVKLAASAFRLGEEKDAKAALTDLARFAPEYALPPGFPPVFQREFEKAKKRLDKQPKGNLTIEGPSGATAFLDGRDLGMVPVLEENVLGGSHLVRVDGPKGERFGQTVAITGGPVKVKASFSAGGGERAVVTTKAGIVDPTIGSSVDADTQSRLVTFIKSVGADFAVIAYVSKTSDTQLTASPALFSAKKGAFVALNPVVFDTDVLTANTEAFKLSDDVSKHLATFGTPSTLPINLSAKAKAGTTTVARTDTPTNTDPDELQVAGPKTKKTVLVPKDDKPKNDDPPVATVVKDPGSAPPAAGNANAGVPVWVWVVTGVAVAAGAGVGGYFGVTALTKPVTGTVTATW